MDAKAKAAQMGISVQAVHQNWKADNDWEGGQKVGKKLVFPDPPSDSSNGTDEYLDIEIAKKKKMHWEAEKARQECLKVTNINKASSGQLVDRSALDAKYKEIFTSIRTKVLALPGRLKRAVGDEFTDRCEETLEVLVNDLLDEVAGSAK